MRNKYNYDELVKVNGIGKELGKVENKLGFIMYDIKDLKHIYKFGYEPLPKVEGRYKWW